MVSDGNFYRFDIVDRLLSPQVRCYGPDTRPRPDLAEKVEFIEGPVPTGWETE